jgi:hypothetical protein
MSRFTPTLLIKSISKVVVHQEVASIGSRAQPQPSGPPMVILPNEVVSSNVTKPNITPELSLVEPYRLLSNHGEFELNSYNTQYQFVSGEDNL